VDLHVLGVGVLPEVGRGAYLAALIVEAVRGRA